MTSSRTTTAHAQSVRTPCGILQARITGHANPTSFTAGMGYSLALLSLGLPCRARPLLPRPVTFTLQSVLTPALTPNYTSSYVSCSITSSRSTLTGTDLLALLSAGELSYSSALCCTVYWYSIIDYLSLPQPLFSFTVTQASCVTPLSSPDRVTYELRLQPDRTELTCLVYSHKV